MSGWRSEWRSLPPLARFGAMTIGAGALGDVIAHLQGAPPTGGFTAPQQSAHLIILLGMVAALTGVLLDALWPASRRRQTPTITRKGGSHAHR